MPRRRISRAQLDELRKRLPAPFVPITIVHSVIAPNEEGGPPIVEGVCSRFTMQRRGAGIREVWEPAEPKGKIPPLTSHEVEQVRNVRLTLPLARRDVETIVIWRNRPEGAAIMVGDVVVRLETE